MRQATIDITLLQPAVFSLQSGSAGAHRGLDYIPGSTLLGHAAAALYATLEPEDAWLLFHSGHMRFGDGLPAHASSVAWPLPLCWHSEKGGQTIRGQQLLADKLVDPSLPFGTDLRTPTQVRGGYTTSAGDFVLPPRSQTLKTAIDPSTGQAAEGQLFGYEAIAAGQCFIARLQCDDAIPDALWNRVLEGMSGKARLGRSRTAQFGHVNMRVSPTDAPAPVAPTEDTTLTLWLLSDLALESAGQPCLQPDARLIGLPEGSRWLPQMSFLRSRRYSPYNAYRRHYDPERQVISRGSVLRYQLPRPLEADTASALESGIGLHVEAGLGHVAVNPQLLRTASPRFEDRPQPSAPPQRTDHAKTTPHSKFVRALASRRNRLQGSAVEAKAVELHQDYMEILDRARGFNGYAEPPRRSQWGRIKQLASDHRHDRQKLIDALFDSANGALRERPNTGWDLRYGTSPAETLSNWMKEKLHEREGNLAELLGHWAGLVLHESDGGAPRSQAGKRPGAAS